MNRKKILWTFWKQNDINEPFEIIGRLRSLFINNEWIYQEELYTEPFTKQYPNEEYKPSDYFGNADMWCKTIVVKISLKKHNEGLGHE